MSLKTSKSKAVKASALTNVVLAASPRNAETLTEDQFVSLIQANTTSKVLVSLPAITVGRFRTRASESACTEETEDYKELRASMLRNGFNDDLCVWRDQSGVIHLVCGERRYHVLRGLQSTEAAWFDKQFPNGIPCNLVRSESAGWEVAYQENMLRVNITDRDEFVFLRRMYRDGLLPASPDDAAKKISRSVERIKDTLAVIVAGEEVANMVTGSTSVEVDGKTVVVEVAEKQIPLRLAAKVAALKTVANGDGNPTRAQVLSAASLAFDKASGKKEKAKAYKAAINELLGNPPSKVPGKDPAVKVLRAITEDEQQALVKAVNDHDDKDTSKETQAVIAGMRVMLECVMSPSRSFPATFTLAACEKWLEAVMASDIAEQAKKEEKKSKASAK